MNFAQELHSRFPQLTGAVQAASAEQTTIALTGPDVRPIAEYLRAECRCRLVTVFAEDRTPLDGFFYNYYVFEQPGDPCYLILQAPIRGDEPHFPSLAAELPAVNWQEREIQDWFGLARMALMAGSASNSSATKTRTVSRFQPLGWANSR